MAAVDIGGIDRAERTGWGRRGKRLRWPCLCRLLPIGRPSGRVIPEEFRGGVVIAAAVHMVALADVVFQRLVGVGIDIAGEAFPLPATGAGVAVSPACLIFG